VDRPIRQALDPNAAGGPASGRAEREQHLLAEAVGGGDGGGVEDRERLLEALLPYVDELGLRSGEQLEDAVVSRDAAGPTSPSRALTNRSRTRSRSSRVDSRLKLTTSSSSIAKPSAT
jgi:hypothetical protein